MTPSFAATVVYFSHKNHEDVNIEGKTLDSKIDRFGSKIPWTFYESDL